MERLFLTFGEVDKLKQKYPGKIPIIVSRSSNAQDVPDLPRHKFLVSSSITMGQFIFFIRKQIKLPPEKALFFFVDNILPTSHILLSELYHKYKNVDGALRMTYTSENTFG
jgi:GABA(A) receptor-associated protein